MTPTSVVTTGTTPSWSGCLVKTFKDTEGVDLGRQSMAVQRLKEAADEANRTLRRPWTATVNLHRSSRDGR